MIQIKKTRDESGAVVATLEGDCKNVDPDNNGNYQCHSTDLLGTSLGLKIFATPLTQVLCFHLGLMLEFFAKHPRHFIKEYSSGLVISIAKYPDPSINS